MGEASCKNKIIFIYLNDILLEMYNAMTCRIYTLLYNIKLCIKLLKVFCCRPSWICRNDIVKAKCLLLSQVQMLPLGALKE